MAKKDKNKKLNEFDIDDLMVSIYNQIAEWHNDDGTAPGLKQISFSVINEVAAASFKHLNIPYNGEIKLDRETMKVALEKKMKKEEKT